MNKGAVIAVLAVIAMGVFLYFYPLQEETTDLAERAQQYCEDAAVVAVEISRDGGYIKVIPQVVDAPVVLYPADGGQPLRCPVTGTDVQSESCLDAQSVTDWELICESSLATQLPDAGGEQVLFQAVGTLIRNNPGLEPDTWYLSYEEPGQPGLVAMLQVGSSSVCAEGNENYTCVPDDFEQGQRVYVLGEWFDTETVRVIQLDIR